MFSRYLIRLLCALLVTAGVLHAGEVNRWPFLVEQVKADGTVESGEYLVPFLFRKTNTEGARVNGFRPFYLHTRDGAQVTTQVLYPFFTWRTEKNYRSFSFFQLINFHRDLDQPAGPPDRGFDVWPFYFSRATGDPGETYRALFPVAGTIKYRFGFDRLRFALFPLYLDTEKNEAHTTHAPWPFLRFIHGGGQHGFEFWPLFGHRGREGDFDTQFYLWPLGYRDAQHLSDPVPTVKVGLLPFYTRDTGPGLISETYAWPFFGYTHRTEPDHYDEQRYFWPFLVQGRGDQRFVSRWAPFYTHSVIKGFDKTWVGWPVFRHATWTDDGKILQEENKVLFFVYWSQTQRSATNPAAAAAHKRHLWPLLSSWDNGAGRKQLQLFSPFEVFFPTNEPVRQLWSPLVAIYRFEQRAPGDTRGSVLFSLVSWKKSPARQEFHVGPLGWSRVTVDGRWRFSLFDFSRKADNKSPDAPSP